MISRTTFGLHFARSRSGRMGLPSVVLAIAAAGCGGADREEATPFSVPRSSPSASASTPPSTSSTTPPDTPDPHAAVPTAGRQRLLAAIVPKGDIAWFFKAVGPAEAVGGQVESFKALVGSIAFNPDGSPKWTLPAGWQQKPATGMRFATLTATTPGGAVDVSVTPLRIPDEIKAFTLVNVNRWREQIGLEPTTADRLFGPGAGSSELSERSLPGGESALLVDLSGEPKAESLTSPMLPAAHPPLAGAPASPSLAPSIPGAGPGVSPLAYTTPEGWTPGNVGGMRAAAFQIKDGSRVAELTAIPLAAGSGDLLSNVNRWREQVKLPPVDDKTLNATAQAVDVAGAKGQRVELVGPAEAGSREAILGVICTRGDQVWFFKLKGDADLVQKERTHFDEFIRSVRFPDGPNASTSPAGK